MTTHPPPLVPSEVDLRDFAFMPVDVQRLMSSETWVLGTGEQRAAAISLWLQSWHQVPAGSVPNLDLMLADLSKCPKWPRVKEHALRGWVLCSDGRLYHPVVCEKALEAWIEKLANSLSGAAGNSKRWGVAIDVQATREQFLRALGMLKLLAPQSRTFKKKVVVLILSQSRGESGGDSPPKSGGESGGESGGDRKGQGQGQGQGSASIPTTPKPPANPPPVPAAPNPSPAPPEPAPAARPTPKPAAPKPTPAPKPPPPPAAPAEPKAPGRSVAVWEAYSKAYLARYGVEPVRNRTVNGQLANFVERIPADEAPEVAAFFVKHNNALYCNAQHPVTLLLRDAESLRTQWATGTTVADRRAVRQDMEPEWRREQREQERAFYGTAAAKPAATDTVDMEATDAASRLVG